MKLSWRIVIQNTSAKIRWITRSRNNPIKRSVQDPGKYEGKSPEHSVCNYFKDICLLGIENKSYFELIEYKTSDYDENPCSPMSNTNLAYIMIDNEVNHCFARSEKSMWTKIGIERAIGQSWEEESRRIWKGQTYHNLSETPNWRSYQNQRSHIQIFERQTC